MSFKEDIFQLDFTNEELKELLEPLNEYSIHQLHIILVLTIFEKIDDPKLICPKEKFRQAATIAITYSNHFCFEFDETLH